MFPFIIQGSNVVVVIDNTPHTISKTHISYQRVVDAIKSGDWDAVRNLIDTKQTFLEFGKGNITIENGQLLWRGEVVHSALSRRIIAMLQEGFSVEPMINFMDNLMSNPSKRAVDELYGFLEKNSLPITPDGHFLAYKKVRENYFDCHTGTMDNSVGKIVEMERNKVDDDKDRTCSTGLHFCSHSYLSSFGGDRTVIVKINPRDVVSIPSDYNGAKGRTCRYEVIGEVDVAPNDEVEFNKPVQQNANGVKSTAKKGTSAFFRGYSDGYNGNDYDQFLVNEEFTPREELNYSDGYYEGEGDREDGRAARYEFVY